MDRHPASRDHTTRVLPPRPDEMPTQPTMSDTSSSSSAQPTIARAAEKMSKADLIIPPKKPKLSKAERRALQESQRAAKEGGGKTNVKLFSTASANAAAGGETGKESLVSQSPMMQGRSRGKSITNEEEKKDTNAVGTRLSSSNAGEDKTVSLFSHLPRPKAPSEVHHHLLFSSSLSSASATTMQQSSSSSIPHFIHPAIPTLGHLYITQSLMGGNVRCRAMLQTYAILLQSYTPPPTTNDFRHDVDRDILKPAFQYWTTQCRTHSVSMGNAFSFLKLAVANLERELEWDVARTILLESMEAYITERIDYAGKAISKHARSKIQSHGDVILIFGKSEVINRLLLDAAIIDNKTFRVIVVDSRPLLEGRDSLAILSRAGIPCTYILLNALTYLMMREVTIVFLGASALMSNGSVLSRIGSACVALLANSNHIPVLVGCETYKICNRVQLESITGNELGDPDEVACTDCARVGPTNRWNGIMTDGGGHRGSGGEETGKKKEKDMLVNWKDQPNLKLLSLMYDLTPSDFVTGIVTEVGILPPSSVAVLLREMSPESAFFTDNN